MEPLGSQNTKPSSSGWWGFIDKVKQQTENIVNIYKEDIKEFSNTIRQDTTEAIKDPEMGLNGLFGFSEKKEKEKGGVIVNRHEARLLAMENELSTYCIDPPDKEEFSQWKVEFNLQSKTDEISRLLSDKERVREAHGKLVPVAVSYSDFWERYYYRVFKLNQEDERRAALVKRATNSAHSDEEHFSWDEEEEQPAPTKPEVEEYLNKLEDTEEQHSQPENSAGQKSDEEWTVVKPEEPPAEIAPEALPPSKEKEEWDDWE